MTTPLERPITNKWLFKRGSLLMKDHFWSLKWGWFLIRGASQERAYCIYKAFWQDGDETTVEHPVNLRTAVNRDQTVFHCWNESREAILKKLLSDEWTVDGVKLAIGSGLKWTSVKAGKYTDIILCHLQLLYINPILPVIHAMGSFNEYCLLSTVIKKCFQAG